MWGWVQHTAQPSRADWSETPLPDLVSFSVKGASFPGGRCKVLLAGPPNRWVSLPAQPCRWAQGDKIELPRHAVLRGWSLDRPSPRVLWVNHYIGHHRNMNGFWFALAKWRFRLYQACAHDPGANFVLASLSGMPGIMRWLRLDWLRQSGLGHLTAVSGLHVGTLAQVVGWAVVRLACLVPRMGARVAGVDVGHLLAVLFCSLPLLTFVMTTGGAASACRALLCWGVWSLGGVFGLNLHRLSLLGAIAVGMLVWHPDWSKNPGFYFSFVATTILIWPATEQQAEDLCSPSEVKGISKRVGRRFVSWLSQSSWSTSWRLFWALAPLSLWFFQTSSLVAVPANLLAIPVFAGWVLPFGLMAFALAAFSEVLGCPGVAYDLVIDLLFLAGIGGNLILDVAQCLSQFPQGSLWHWAWVACMALIFHPQGRSCSPLHPLLWAPTPLLWVLMGAPLWAS